MAYAFIDNDKYSDIVVINQARDSFAVYFYNPRTTLYELYPWHRVDELNPKLIIKNVIVMKNNFKY